MAQSFKNIALIALVLCFVKAGNAQAAKAQAPALSADETLAYINTTLHKYPTLEFLQSGCPGDEQTVSISEDRRSIVIKQNFFLPAEGGRCDAFQTLTVPIFSLHQVGIGSWSKQAQHSSFVLECTQRVGCFSRRPDAHTLPAAESQWRLQVTAPDKVSSRLERAIEHLVLSLLDEADTHVPANDPFVKHTNKFLAAF